MSGQRMRPSPAKDLTLGVWFSLTLWRQRQYIPYASTDKCWPCELRGAGEAKTSGRRDTLHWPAVKLELLLGGSQFTCYQTKCPWERTGARTAKSLQLEGDTCTLGQECTDWTNPNPKVQTSKVRSQGNNTAWGSQQSAWLCRMTRSKRDRRDGFQRRSAPLLLNTRAIRCEWKYEAR